MIGLGVGLLLVAGAWERPIDVGPGGRVAVVVDRQVRSQARLDLGDVRVVDEQGHLVPFLVERFTTTTRTRLEPRLLNREFVRGQQESVTLDFGEAVSKDSLVLALSGDNFRRRVSVEASDDGRAFTTLTEDAYVFAIPGNPPSRFETVRLPANDRRYLRVVVHHGDGDGPRFDILSAAAEGGPRRVGRSQSLTPRLSRFEDPELHETQLVLDLEARGQPFEEIRLELADASFFRSVVVEARRDDVTPRSDGAPRAARWVGLGGAALYRYSERGQLRQQTAIHVAGRERAVRLRIRNRDDRPLDVTAVSVVVPVERLVFEAVPGHVYRLRYGGPAEAPPEFDLARTAGDPAAFGASAVEVRLQEPRALAAGADTRPWTERHPRLLWTALLLVVAALGAVTWRALRAA